MKMLPAEFGRFEEFQIELSLGLKVEIGRIS